MLVLASVLRVLRRLVVAATAFVFVAITWTVVLRLAAAPAPSELSMLLWAIGTPLLRPFDSLVQPATFSNGGTFSWMSLVAFIAYALLAAFVAWLFKQVAERLAAAYLASQGPSLEELRERAPLPR